MIVGGVVVIIIALILFFVVISSHKSDKVNMKLVQRFPVPVTEATTDIGASTDGVYVLNNGDDLKTKETCLEAGGTWSGSHCQCNIPFYGSRCERESHDSDYKTLAHFDLAELGHTKLKIKNNLRLSFDPELKSTCTELCDADCECDAVHYSDGVCTLLSNLFYSGDFINHSDSDSIPTIFLKNRVKFKNRAFLWEGDLPLNYWSAKKTNDFLPLDRNIVESESKAPQFVINDTGSSILISSSKGFENENTITIHGCITDGDLTLPHEWTHPISNIKFYIKLRNDFTDCA